VTAKQAMNVSQDALSNVKVREIMSPVNSLVIMHQDDHAYEALKNMYKSNKSRVFVCSPVYPKVYKNISEPCKVIGIVSKTDILNAASENQEYIHNLAKA
jgi:predicted transcriptional regulator